ncbi:Similar to hypothetical protein [Tuber melanosporum Mel28]; acc. no. XP_002840030 [Pyronema omphalodes CBS 100304]|uniref:Uncharacterized protein n=1 Tax=Pyronema omphalodes (strain CBS 100304) TaxID=1076935 RepID=U4LSJ1_PYROM|nr:Similar to hypothetical protein [Tuber melanosporum Mel28]; acc. no. XP_002840030 [Pyronema omphalodes CBS 100304]
MSFTPPPSLHLPSSNFVFAASTASYCLTTSRVLLCHDTHANPPYYFLPRGRKDVHEHIQSAAIRETFEEGGYRVRLVRGQHRTLQPRGMGVSEAGPAANGAETATVKSPGAAGGVYDADGKCPTCGRTTDDTKDTESSPAKLVAGYDPQTDPNAAAAASTGTKAAVVEPALPKGTKPSPASTTALTIEGHTEPFWTLLQPYPRRHHLPQSMEDIALYIASYYLAEILGPRDSAYGRSFVGKHEGGYDSGLYPIEEAVELLTRGRMFVKDGILRWSEAAAPVSGMGCTIASSGGGGRYDWEREQGGREVLWEQVLGKDTGAVEACVVWFGWECVRGEKYRRDTGERLEWEEGA